MVSKLSQLVKENRPLFWSVGDENLEKIDELSVVETILNYGNMESLKKLFFLLGTQRVADIFYNQLSQKRNNYYPQVRHFFDLYFTRHVKKYS